MCEPMTMLALAATIGSTALGAAGQMQQAQATADANRYSAQIADMNATLAERRAKDALERGAKDEQQKRRETAALMGKQQAAMAANGVDLTFGSPLDVLVDTAMLGELDALTIRSSSYREEHDMRVGAYNQRAQASMKRVAADNAETAGAIGAAGTILGGVGSAFKTYKTGTVGSIG